MAIATEERKIAALERIATVLEYFMRDHQGFREATGTTAPENEPPNSAPVAPEPPPPAPVGTPVHEYGAEASPKEGQGE